MPGIMNIGVIKRSCFLTFLSIVIVWAVDVKEGEQLFKTNCTACHRIERKLIGPALKGVHERWDNMEEEMIAFIKNSQKYMKAGRPKSQYAQQLFEKFNRTVMQNFEHLSDDQIRSILAYIKEASKQLEAQAAAAAPEKKEEEKAPTTTELYRSVNFALWVIIIGIFVTLLLIFALANVARAKKEGEEVTKALIKQSVKEAFTNPYFIGIVTVVVVSACSVAVVKKARSVGLHKGYQPVQPIAFSHKLHAGELQISCQYCHVGVERSKMATIPSLNICMNCHKYVQEGPKYGKKEIAKIYKAIGFDPENMRYIEGYEQKPIEWVRIHNLPDFVYFSHAQHVKVGLDGAKDPETLRQTCAKCHGPVWEMEEVYQYSDLSMGWCVNCHRTTKVDVNKSDYYRIIHKDYLNSEEPVTVETLGGLECARCHY